MVWIPARKIQLKKFWFSVYLLDSELLKYKLVSRILSLNIDNYVAFTQTKLKLSLLNLHRLHDQSAAYSNTATRCKESASSLSDTEPVPVL